MFYVYYLTNKINGKLYIGYTENPHRRALQHKTNSFNINSKYYKSYIAKAIRKYGYKNFAFDIVEKFSNKHDALDAEIWNIIYLKSLGAHLYNLSDGGEGGNTYWLGKSIPIEIRNKMSESRKGKYIGEKNPMYGKNHTTEVKKIISKHNTKISDDLVKEIRRLNSTDMYTGRQLSKLFNLSTAQISRIINNKQRSL